MTCEIVCRYEATKVDVMNKLKRHLEDKDLADFRNRNRNIKHFNWGTVDKCRFGVTCYKVTKANSEFCRLERELDILLSAYIEKTCHEHKESIFNFLRGNFPAAYRQFEIELRRKGE